jgi:hypothetical protein
VFFTFALIDELFRLSFRNLTAIRNLGTYVFRWGTVMVLLASSLTVFTLPAEKRFAGLSNLILNVDRGARAMLCLLAVLLLLGARSLRIPVRSVLFGITSGFVLYLLTRVVVDSIALRSGSSVLCTRINSVVYLSSCLLWLFYAIYGVKVPAGAYEGPETTLDAFYRPSGTTVIDAINALVEKSMRAPAKEQLRR